MDISVCGHILKKKDTSITKTSSKKVPVSDFIWSFQKQEHKRRLKIWHIMLTITSTWRKQSSHDWKRSAIIHTDDKGDVLRVKWAAVKSCVLHPVTTSSHLLLHIPAVSVAHVCGRHEHLAAHSQFDIVKEKNVVLVITSYHILLWTLVDGDPHFMIELPDRNDTLCFNINNKPGTIFNLVRDPVSGQNWARFVVFIPCVQTSEACLFPSGILVNGQIIGDKKIPPDGVINTYFYRFGITHRPLGVRLEVNTEVISVYQGGNWIKLLWSEASSLKGPK